MFWDSFAVFFALIYWVLRMIVRAVAGSPARTSVLRHGRTALMGLVSRRGGYMQESPGRLLYTDASGDTRLEIGYGSHPGIRIRTDRPIPFHGVLYRIPRLWFAFLDGFFASSRRIAPFYSPSAHLTRKLMGNLRIVELLQRLGAYGFSAGFDSTGVRVWRRLRGAVPRQELLAELIDLTDELAATCATPVTAKVQRIPSEVHCAYCKEAIASAPDVISCRDCGAAHHSECFAMNGGCSVFGCVSARDAASVTGIAYGR